MTPAILNRSLNLDFETFLDYDFGAENETRYELEDGNPIAMPDPSAQHEICSDFLADEFRFEVRRQSLPYLVKRNISLKTGEKGSRKPDVMVFPKSYWEGVDLTKPAAVRRSPSLVVEIASQGNFKVDYRQKQLYYVNAGAAEYWIVDCKPFAPPSLLNGRIEPAVTVFSLEDGMYQPTYYGAGEIVRSRIFPDLKLTADQIFAGDYGT